MYRNICYDEANLPVDLVNKQFVGCDFTQIDFSTRICTPEQFRNCSFYYCSGIDNNYVQNGNLVIN